MKELCDAIMGNDIDEIERLILLSTDLNVKYNGNDGMISGFTPLHVAVFCNRHAATEMLLKHKADVHLTTDSGDQAVHLAAKECNKIIMHSLLEAGADINALAKYNMTPLMHAVHKGSIQLVTFLLERKADTSIKNDTGNTALSIAQLYCEVGDYNDEHKKIVEILIRYEQNQLDSIASMKNQSPDINTL